MPEKSRPNCGSTDVNVTETPSVVVTEQSCPNCGSTDVTVTETPWVVVTKCNTCGCKVIETKQ